MATAELAHHGGSRSDGQPPAQALCGYTAHSLASVDPRAWDALVACGNGALRHGYLRAWEHVELSGLHSRPLLAREAGATAPFAACPGYLYDLDLTTARWPQSAPVMSAIRRIWPRFLIARTYELGSPIPLSNPFLVADPTRRREAVHVLIAEAMREAERCRAEFILVQNFHSKQTAAGEELAALGFAGVPIPATAVVHLPYGTFEEYLGAMRAQYRRRARKTLKATASLSVEHRNRFEDLADELARLYRAVFDRAHEVKRELLTPAFFVAASRLEHTSMLILRRQDGSIASFGLLLSHHPWLSFLHCGFEEDAGRQEGAYFRLLYEIVRTGIEGGYEHVDLGLTTLAPKFDVGAVPILLYAWIRHRNPVLQRLIRLLAEGPLRPEPIEPRRVFKDPPPPAAEIAERRLATA